MKRTHEHLTLVIPVRKPVPRFGVIHTRREAPKKGTYKRRDKHAGRQREESFT